MTVFEEIYYTMLGDMCPEYALPWVENAYADGSHCDRAYSEMRDAYSRICERLDVEEEDNDLEIIVTNLLDIQKELCARMFDCGMQYVRGRRYLHPRDCLFSKKSGHFFEKQHFG